MFMQVDHRWRGGGAGGVGGAGEGRGRGGAGPGGGAGEGRGCLTLRGVTSRVAHLHNELTLRLHSGSAS